MTDILVICYGPGCQKYLDDCLKSIERQTDKNHKVYVISSGDYNPQTQLSTSMDVSSKHFHQRMHFPEAVNEGVKLTRSENILICNDDIIMQKDCLKTLVEEIEKHPDRIINPTSTCDNGRFFDLPLGFKMRGFLHLFDANHYTHDQISPHYVHEIINSMHILNPMVPGEMIVKYAAFYCTMMKRSTWNTVGGIDTKLKTGQDDLDFCLRAKAHGISSFITHKALAFHYSGASADIYLTKEDRQWNIDYFNKKWESKGIKLGNI